MSEQVSFYIIIGLILAGESIANGLAELLLWVLA